MSTPFCLMMAKMDGVYMAPLNKILLNIKLSLLKVMNYLVDCVLGDSGFCTKRLTLLCFRALSGFSFGEVGCIRTRNKVTCCHFSSDGKLLASAGHDKKVTRNTTMFKTLLSLLLQQHSKIRFGNVTGYSLEYGYLGNREHS